MKLLKTILFCSCLILLKACSNVGHPGEILSLAQSPNGNYFASSDTYGNRFIWDKNFNRIKSIPNPTGAVSSIVFSPDSSFIISSSWNKKVEMWTIEGIKLCDYKAHSDSIWELVIYNNGNYIATASNDKTIRIWNLNGSLVKTFCLEPEYAASLCFGSDSKYIFAGLSNGVIVRYNIVNNKKVLFLNHTKEIKNILYYPKRKKIISNSIDGKINIWDYNGNLLNTINTRSDGIAITEDGMIVSGFEDIILWDLSGNKIKTIKGYETIIKDIIYDRKDNSLISVSYDKNIRIWDIETGKCIKKIGLPWYEKNFRI